MNLLITTKADTFRCCSCYIKKVSMKNIETIQEEIVEPHICIQLFPFYVMIQSRDPSQIVRGQ